MARYIVLYALASVIVFMLLMSALFANQINSEINNYKIDKIARNYHLSHTYTKNEMFVCLDMAIDLWNVYRTAGFNAKIALGNLEVQNVTVETINHAWLFVERSPFSWIAVDPVTGQVISSDDKSSMAYFNNAFSFHTPSQVKKYIEFRTLYLDELKKIGVVKVQACEEYKNYIREYNDIVENYNQMLTVRRLDSYDSVTYTQITDYLKRLDNLKILIANSKVNCDKETSDNYVAELQKLNDLSEKMNLLLI